MDEKSVPNWGLWVGARRLEGYCLGPISCGLPRGGGSLGDRLGARATPLSVRPQQMPTHCSLLTACEPRSSSTLKLSSHTMFLQGSHTSPSRYFVRTSVFAEGDESADMTWTP